ncbi:helix-turn-helix domain-containing protein [Haloechinothrix alba]|uniref:helix-turn-helix domain-containing protein n=1 Tax=Haloechinothrix alba TaxID=664784 RepID=UPI000B78EB7B|nr:helix-turn-helix domain-containing protein [Haloechinothrix alba]
MDDLHWLSLDEAAIYTRSSKRTIYRAVHRGDLLSYQRTRGGKHRFATEDLDAWARGERPLPLQVVS